MSKHDSKMLAEQLYVQAGMTFKAIAEKLTVTEKTIGSWAKQGQWKELRAAHTITKDKIVKNLYLNILEIQEKAQEEERILSSKESDQIVKLSQTIENLDKRIALSVIIQVFQDFELHLAQIDPDFTKILNEHHTEYIHTHV